ncbi:histidine phosphatase family protein [Paenibacillus sp. FSL R10-2771]|uniref:histidine phosphatase family protein n=1 Tax=Paenibacillus sp. FSL R10-2771 TaxID=2954693 RepID=UPI0030FCFF46
MATIGLIRHGITEWNIAGRAQGLADIPLNREGREQAVKLAGRLRKERWDIMISSHLCRARETAEIIAAASGIEEHLIDERICEMDCGQLEGLNEAEWLGRWGQDWRSLELGMETAEDVSRRGALVLEELYNRYGNKKILVVSHGALIGLTLQHLLPQVFTTTYIDNASLTLLTKTNNNWDCQLYNCVEHLV